MILWIFSDKYCIKYSSNKYFEYVKTIQIYSNFGIISDINE